MHQTLSIVLRVVACLCGTAFYAADCEYTPAKLAQGTHSATNSLIT
jgi:hypothetical protein